VSVKYSTRWRKDDHIEVLTRCNQINLHDREIRDLDLSEMCGSLDLETLSLANNRLTAIDLRPIENCSGLKKLFLDGNQIHEINLNPLKACRNLKTLGLSNNQLTEVDLAPLTKMNDLEYIYLNDNQITEIDLFPLHRCYKLKGINLQGNLLKDINVAPLLFCQNLTVVDLADNPNLATRVSSDIDGIPSVLMDALIQWAKQRGKPPWILNANVDLSVTSAQFGRLIKRLGWNQYRNHLISALRLLAKDRWYDAQLDFLTSIGMQELACYEGDIVDILMKIPENCTYPEGRDILYSEIVKLLRKQIESGGSTLLLDIDTLSKTEGSVLIPSILEGRKKEMEKVTIYVIETRLDLEDVWRTYYGSEILDAMDVSPSPRVEKLEEIKTSLEKAGFCVEVTKAKRVRTPGKQSWKSQMLLEYKLYGAGFLKGWHGVWKRNEEAKQANT
jgi:hypothetical protein